MSKDLMYKRIRNICGLLGGVLPFIAIASVLLISDRPEGSLNSISATYYLSPALTGILTAAAIVLMTYDGYEWIDNLVTTISGIFGIGIVLFPCSVDFMCGAVGFFQLDKSISNTIHCVCAVLFFILLAINSLFLFTKTDDILCMTNEKKIRNKIYIICGIGMIITMVIYTVLRNFIGGPLLMITEILLLFFFCFSWLTKGGVFFCDK